jgi:hypothetical protein
LISILKESGEIYSLLKYTVQVFGKESSGSKFDSAGK